MNAKDANLFTSDKFCEMLPAKVCTAYGIKTQKKEALTAQSLIPLPSPPQHFAGAVECSL
jgi:hypothetical protein